MSPSAIDILSALFNPNENVCFRIFDDKKEGIFQGAKLTCECGKYETIEEDLKRHNSMNRAISFVVNYGGHDDGSITRINAQFVEMDNCSFEEQQKKIDAFPLPPSMIIKTQKSLHVYWFMDKSAEVSRFRGIQKALVKHFDGDPMCVNESRAMRLPGFMHCKKEIPVEVTCICFHPERKYSQDQLAEALPEISSMPLETQQTPPSTDGNEKGLQIVMSACDFLKHCKNDAVTLSEPEWYAMISNLTPFAGGTEMIHELSKPYPGYNEINTQRKIEHYLASNTKPMTCQTIRERGFACPKLLDNTCNCKSPASLSFLPADPKILKSIVSVLPVTGDQFKDLETARAFVTNYLYNQDAGIAEYFIESELQKRFDLKKSFEKSLKNDYKAASKEYQADKQAKIKQPVVGLPEWYEITDDGKKRFLPGVLAKNMIQEHAVFYSGEQFYIYVNGSYHVLKDEQAKNMIREKMLVREAKTNQILDTMAQWRMQILQDEDKLNSNPYIINVQNGLYNVLENSLSPHTPNYLSTIQLPVNYLSEADCPLFKKYLAESMAGDMDQVKLIQEILGYTLFPVNSAQKSFVFVGAAAAGKSVLLRVINDLLLGKENVSNVPWQSLNERFKTSELFGKLANTFADLPTKNIDDNGIFKALVGEDYITGERKNKNPFSFISFAKLIFSCNSIPKNYGDRSEGFYRRLIIIRFNNTVSPEKRDPHLLDKFRAEADGIFLFALEGLKRLIKNDFRFSEAQKNIDELQRYREDSDSVLSFVNEYCELDSTYSVGSTELYNVYKQYCDECGMRPYSQKTFVQQIKAGFPDTSNGVDKTGKRRVINGIRLGEILE